MPSYGSGFIGSILPSVDLPDPPTFDEVKEHLAAVGLADAFTDASIELMMRTAMGISFVTIDAYMFLVTHLLVVFKSEGGFTPDGGSGEVSSESGAGRAVSYMTLAETNRDTFFSMSYWGRMFLTMEKRSARRTMPIIVG